MRAFMLVVLSLLFAAPAAAQFNDANHPVAAQQAIGGPVGSPTYVLKAPAEGGFISIGKPFGDFLEPYVDALVQALIAGLVSWLAYRIKQRTGVEIDKHTQDILTKALSNQAGSLIADGMVKVEDGKVNVHSEALAHATEDLMKSIPAAAKHFGLTPDYVSKRIVDTIPQIAAGAQMIAASAQKELP